ILADGAAGNVGTYLFIDRQAFTGEHRLIHRCLTGEDGTIDRNACAGLTTTIFLTRTCLAGTSTSCPSLRRMAVFGIIDTSELIACLAEFLLLSSRNLPSSTSATTTAADSK